MDADAVDQLKRPESTSFYISQLVQQGMEGLIRIPRFQRNFVWDAADVRDLFDSIWRGFPIGTLLLWRNRAESGAVEFGPLTFAAPERTDALWVVDGQQRIASLVGALNSRYRNVDRRFEVYFDLRRRQFVTAGQAPPPPTWVPLHRTLETKSLLAWLREGADDLEPDDYDTADALGGALRDYRVPAYVVVGDNDTLLRKVFDRVNSAGKPIGRADVFHALFASRSEPGSPQAVVESLSRLGFGTVDSDRVVQSLLALRGGNIQRDLHDEFGKDEDPADWFQRTDESLSLSIGFLRRQGIPHLQLVPSTLPLPVLAAFFYLHADPAPWTLTLLSRWLWRGWVFGFGRRGQTPALRQAVHRVNPRKAQPDLAPPEDAAALSLLSTVPDEPDFDLRLDPFRTDHAAARLAVLALASLHPLDLDGHPLDLAEEFEKHGVEAVTDLVRGHRGQLGARGLWPKGAKLPTGFEDERVLESHAVTSEAAVRLQNHEIPGFLDLRSAHVKRLLNRYLHSRLQPRSIARPALATLVVPDGE